MTTIHPRSYIGTPEPSSTRSRLRGVKVLLAHEVGVNTPSTGRYRSADPARVLSDARAAASYGISAGKTWEYNWMIGLDGSIFTQAGEYVAAHCLNFNNSSAAVIFLNASDVPLTQAQINSWHDVRDHAVNIGVLVSNHEVAPHYRYRTTSCCGIHADRPGAAWSSPTGQGRLGNLRAALLTREVAPPPPPPQPPPAPVQNYKRIVMAQSFEFATAPRWDTRGFGAPLPAGEYSVKLAGSEGKVGATVNFTVVSPVAAGFGSLWSSGPREDKSKINYSAGQTIANEVSVPLAADGSFKVFISTPAHILFDLTGYWLA